VCGSANATPVIAPISDFGAPGVTFTGVPSGTALNGLTINGFTFSETISNTFVSTLGPGDTTNITQPSALGNGNPAGEVLTILLPNLMSEFGFGYAVIALQTVPDAVTVTLFNGATNLGSLSYTGAPDPIFSGGFAGIANATPFDRVTLSFSSVARAYDFDNIRSVSVVPEPATLTLLGTGLLALGRRRLRPRRPLRAD
jgi:hypothetical protein